MNAPYTPESCRIFMAGVTATPDTAPAELESRAAG